MYKQSFGTKNQISFSNENDYYELLGYLAKSGGTTSIHWEHNENQGAWGSEGRIHFYVTPPANLNANLSHTAGVNNVVLRVNCNEFVKNITTDHGFVMGKIQNENDIRATIPENYMADFDRGLNL